MTQRVLHFSLGPVQTFVAQSRRTRDLWAGSFLLSWLVGVAMGEVIAGGGRITAPAVEQCDPLLAAIRGDRRHAPRIGSLPNRFRAEVPEEFDPHSLERAVANAWGTLAQVVWEEILQPVAKHGHGSRAIWDRQIASFWEAVWVAGKAPMDRRDGLWLHYRKHWRVLRPGEEGGDHCTVMGEFQEISGHTVHERQRAFWHALQQRVGRLELRDEERLSAVALVKRLFPLLGNRLKGILGWVPGGDPVALRNWPSTAYLAAVPWLRAVAQQPAHRQALKHYLERVQTVTGDAFRRHAGEHAVGLACLEPLRSERVAERTLDALDGNLYIPSALANHRATPLFDEPERINEEPATREALSSALAALNRAVDATAGHHYALLLMDGDRLGDLLRDPALDETAIARALADFSGRVAEIVADHCGVTVYVGGDDLLALLPVDEAVPCAIELSTAYAEAFRGALAGRFDTGRMTLSGALVLAHYRLPLHGVLGTAHTLLEETAKAGNGRNSLAVTVWRSSGRNEEWVARFPDGPRALLALQRRMADFASGFFHKLQRRYPLLKTPDHGLDEPALVQLLAAEYLRGVEPHPGLPEVEALIRTLVAACRRDGHPLAAGQIQWDGAFVARFLAGCEPTEEVTDEA